jgi:hypothetical protein
MNVLHGGKFEFLMSGRKNRAKLFSTWASERIGNKAQQIFKVKGVHAPIRQLWAEGEGCPQLPGSSVGRYGWGLSSQRTFLDRARNVLGWAARPLSSFLQVHLGIPSHMTLWAGISAVHPAALPTWKMNRCLC